MSAHHTLLAALVEEFDRAYSRLLEGLERQVLAEEALVEFLSREASLGALQPIPLRLADPRGFFLAMGQAMASRMRTLLSLPAQDDTKAIAAHWTGVDMLPTNATAGQRLERVRAARDLSLSAVSRALLSDWGVDRSEEAAVRMAVQSVLSALALNGSMVPATEAGEEVIFQMQIERSAGDLTWHLPTSQAERLLGAVDGLATLTAIEGEDAISRLLAEWKSTLESTMARSQFRYENLESVRAANHITLVFHRDAIQVALSRPVATAFRRHASQRAGVEFFTP